MTSIRHAVPGGGQIFKYSNIQILADTQTSALTNLCTHKPLHTQTSALTNLCTHKPLHIQISAHTNLCTHKPLHSQTSAHTNLCTHKPLHSQTSAHTNLCTHRPVHTQISVHTISAHTNFCTWHICTYAQHASAQSIEKTTQAVQIKSHIDTRKHTEALIHIYAKKASTQIQP